MKLKSENRKALPRFVLIIALGLIVGLLCGIGIAMAEGSWS